MSNTTIECCAIVVTYNGVEWIERCISSLKTSSIPVDIVVVDNGSQDGTLQFLEGRPDIKLFKNNENVGFGKANNIGLEYAFYKGFEYFFLLNQDAWIEENTLKDLLMNSANHPEYGILSPVHFDGQGTNLDPGFGKYMRLRPSSGFYKDFKNNLITKKIYQVSFVNAAAWLITRDCLSNVGLFHPLFKHYGEDDNYVHRVKSAGFKVGVLSESKMYHDREQRFKKRIDKKAKFRSMVLMVHLNPLKKRNKLILWLISMGNLLSIPGFWFFLPNLPFYGWGLAAYFKFAKEVKQFGSKDFNPLKSRKSQ